MTQLTKILIVYDTDGGNTYAMAKKVARGVDGVSGCEAVIRSVPKVHNGLNQTSPAVPESGAPYVTLEDLDKHQGLVMGSPTHFGNMSASLKYFIDQTSTEWMAGALNGKPAGVFTSTGSMHGGQEAALLTMIIPLLHHGMIITGLPYTHPGLMQTTSGGTPYGASHLGSESGDRAMDTTETELCMLLGNRVATLAQQLN